MTGRDGSDVALQLPSDIGGFGARKTGLRAIDCQLEGDRSFALRLQPKLDQAADGFGACKRRLFLPFDPVINHFESRLLPSHADLKASARGCRPAALLFRGTFN